MVNNLFSNREFMPHFLRRFGTLGPVNASLQRTLSAFFQWKKQQPAKLYREPNLFEFYDMAPLADAEKIFYQAGLPPLEAVEALDRHLDRLLEFARYILAHIHASVLGSCEALTNAPFIASLSLRNTTFDPAKMAETYARFSASQERHDWNLNPFALAHFIVESPAVDSRLTDREAVQQETSVV